MNIKKPVALIVLDGWGYREDVTNNAIAQAKKPVFDNLWKNFPHTILKADGEAVGLPNGQMGNSEVGHTTIGAGKPIYSDLARIDKAIKNGGFDKNLAFLKLFEHIKKNKSTLHILGLLGEGGVHSHSNHLYAFLKLAKKNGINGDKIAIDIFTDGRDTPPQSAACYIKNLEDFLSEINVGFINTISGRYYAMDRDNNWDRLLKVERALFECKGDVQILKNIKISNFIESLYKEGKSDEILEPIICLDEIGKSCCPIKNDDGVFFFNFRADRARMLSLKILERAEKMNLCFTTLTEYNPEYKTLVAFPPIKIETTLAAEISKAGLMQAHIAETEKYAHATYFLNGKEQQPYKKETDILLDSRKDVRTHDEAPEMRAEAIADKVLEQIKNGTDFIFVNFANADMVGHTANVNAIIKAVEKIDKEIGRIVMAIEKAGGVAFITADHGNAEINIDPNTGKMHTAHTTNPVPAILTDKNYSLRQGEKTLADVAPTILEILGLSIPKSMTGKSLLDVTQK